jgi:hypothetical protein
VQRSEDLQRMAWAEGNAQIFTIMIYHLFIYHLFIYHIPYTIYHLIPFIIYAGIKW